MPFDMYPLQTWVVGLGGVTMIPGPPINPGQQKILREKSYELLKSLTGQDFGYDQAKWKEWLINHPEGLYDK